ncbi:ankyrin repeat domain-containing protein [Burkholderiaceae bacterium FT117]|uniref:ankyrin repeat domain-containing protein n=1 Tax=Zeimonas sediminis TaxID=2944268 RepID=UPI002342BEAB|nr:ankyrin repeat domain-containing protein [Zeimonas sediminis]MCM5569252.1 ankyrin repeat domain-containing protein [Zeimonas sediminis]
MRRRSIASALVFALVAACAACLLPGVGTAWAQSSGPAASQGFWEAIRLDDVKAMETEMLRGSSANAVHPEFGPAIVVAARERSPRALAYLARLAGTRIDATNRGDETALMLVALQGDLTSARLLVQRGAEVNRPGWTPLHYAASGGHLEMIRFLLDENAYIDAQSPNRTTPLMMAARQKHTNAVRLLVEAGADPTQRNEAGLGAIEYMERHGETEQVRWLKERAAEFERRYGTIERPRTAPAQAEGVPPAAQPKPQAAPAAPATTAPAPRAAPPASAPRAAPPAPAGGAAAGVAVRPVSPPAAEALPPPSELAVPVPPIEPAAPAPATPSSRRESPAPIEPSRALQPAKGATPLRAAPQQAPIRSSQPVPPLPGMRD